MTILFSNGDTVQTIQDRSSKYVNLYLRRPTALLVSITAFRDDFYLQARRLQFWYRFPKKNQTALFMVAGKFPKYTPVSCFQLVAARIITEYVLITAFIVSLANTVITFTCSRQCCVLDCVIKPTKMTCSLFIIFIKNEYG